MTKKEIFIKEIEDLKIDLSEDAKTFFESLKLDNEPEKVAFTNLGVQILRYMRDNKETYNNLFTSKVVGEGLEVSSRTVAGSYRKLFSDGYVEKIGNNPISYSLTDLGKTVELPNL